MFLIVRCILDQGVKLPVTFYSTIYFLLIMAVESKITCIAVGHIKTINLVLDSFLD